MSGVETAAAITSVPKDISEIVADGSVTLADSCESTFDSDASVDCFVSRLQLIRDEERRLIEEYEQDRYHPLNSSIEPLRPCATACGFLVDKDGKFSAMVTTRDLVENMVRARHSGKPLSKDDMLSKISTDARRVCSLRRGHTVNFLFNYMARSGEHYRHVPLLSAQGRLEGVFLLKHLLSYAIGFMRRDERTVVAHLRLPPYEGAIVDTGDSLETAINRMNKSRRRCVFAVEGAEAKLKAGERFQVAGMLSEWDLVQAVLIEDKPLTTPVAEVMMCGTIAHCTPQDTMLACARKLLECNHHQLMILDDGHFGGILSLRSLIDYVADFFPQAVHCIEARDPGGIRFNDRTVE